MSTISIDVARGYSIMRNEGEAANLPFKDVLIVSQYYPPEPGAPQVRLSNMAKVLTQMGVNVRVITGMPNYPNGEIQKGYRGRITMKQDVDGIQVRRLWLFPAAGRGAIRRLANYLSFTLMALPALLFTRRPDLVFVEAQPLTLAIPAWITKVVRGVPYIYNTPDLQVEVAQEGGWIGMGALIKTARWLETFLMRQSLSVTTVTHAFMDHFIQTRNVPSCQMSFLPNGADTDQLRPLPYDHELAEKFNIGSRKVFTYAGTHAHYQGLEVIVQAAQHLRDRDDIVILMAGQGPVRRELVESVQALELDNILFVDSPFEEMHRLMSITYASLVVLRDIPSSHKMRLSKAIPPLACGIPVIFAGPGETAEILEQEKCGVTVAAGRPDLLAGAIRQLAEDEPRRAAMSKRGRDMVERGFTWKSIVKNWYEQISLISNKKSNGARTINASASAVAERPTS